MTDEIERLRAELQREKRRSAELAGLLTIAIYLAGAGAVWFILAQLPDGYWRDTISWIIGGAYGLGGLPLAWWVAEKLV